MDWIMRWWRRGWVLGLLAGVLGWAAMAAIGHLWNDHTLLHTLVQIELMRQQGQGASPPPSVPTAAPTLERR